MKAGKYWVGDLCYVLSHATWAEVCKLTIEGETVKQGEFTLPDGRQFATLSTKYGDGVYHDQDGDEYGVDSGSIGCILVRDADEVSESAHLGQVIAFPEDFNVMNDDGMLYFGRIAIDTSLEDFL